VASLHALNSGKIPAHGVEPWDFAKVFEGWDAIFDKVLKGFEDKASQVFSWVAIVADASNNWYRIESTA
jgi:hypothetical protein